LVFISAADTADHLESAYPSRGRKSNKKSANLPKSDVDIFVEILAPNVVLLFHLTDVFRPRNALDFTYPPRAMLRSKSYQKPPKMDAEHLLL